MSDSYWRVADQLPNSVVPLILFPSTVQFIVNFIWLSGTSMVMEIFLSSSWPVRGIAPTWGTSSAGELAAVLPKSEAALHWSVRRIQGQLAIAIYL